MEINNALFIDGRTALDITANRGYSEWKVNTHREKRPIDPFGIYNLAIYAHFERKHRTFFKGRLSRLH